MSAPVDVLAVMDDAANHADGGSAPMNGDAIREAREIVAGLLSLLRELIDIEGPQPGHVEWFRRVQAALARVGGAA